jgi:hypothetical protein
MKGNELDILKYLMYSTGKLDMDRNKGAITGDPEKSEDLVSDGLERSDGRDHLRQCLLLRNVVSCCEHYRYGAQPT